MEISMKGIRVFIISIIIILFFFGCEYLRYEGDNTERIFIEEYLPYTEGHGIKYHITDEYCGFDSEIWAVFQAFCETARYSYTAFSQVTIEKNSEHMLSNKEGQSRTFNGIDFYFNHGLSSDQGHFVLPQLIPKAFLIGDQYNISLSSSSADRAISIEIEGLFTNKFGDHTIDNCIKIFYDVEGFNEYADGQGYYIFAPEIGIVEIFFTRTKCQSSVHFTYLKHKSFNPISISGTIHNDGNPVEGIHVQHSPSIYYPNSLTDDTGIFTLPAVYGPSIELWLGYAENGNTSIEYGSPDEKYPIRIFLNNITNNIENFEIDLGEI